MERLNTAESAVFIYCRFSLFLKDPFSILFRSQQLSLFLCGVQLLPVRRYSVDIFSYSGPLGIIGSNGKQNTACAKGRENCCTFHKFS